MTYLGETFARRMKWQIGLGIAAVWVISLLLSYQEFRYMLSGQTVEAKLEGVKVHKSEDKHGDDVKRIVSYAFQDRDKLRRESAEVPTNWDAGKSDTVKVQYVPGQEGMSRVSGQRHLVWVAIFAGSLVLLLIAVVIMIRG